MDRLGAAGLAGIHETSTLNARLGREEADERHICPLQLDFIERCVRLWSNPGETVFSPFAGIGSEVYTAVKLGRRGVGIELKPSYWQSACTTSRARAPDGDADTAGPRGRGRVSLPYHGPVLVATRADAARILSALYGAPTNDTTAQALMEKCRAVLNSDPRYRELLKP